MPIYIQNTTKQYGNHTAKHLSFYILFQYRWCFFHPFINPSDCRLQIFLRQAQEPWHGQKIWSKFSTNFSSPNLVLRQARNPPPLQNFRATCHKIKANVVTWSAVWRVAAVSTARSSQELRPTGGFGMGSAAPIHKLAACSINWWIKGPSWLLRPDWCSFCFTARFPPLSFKHHIRSTSQLTNPFAQHLKQSWPIYKGLSQ